jgi:hypothetical protein
MTGARGIPAKRRLMAVVRVPQAQRGVIMPMKEARKTLMTP